MRWPWYLVVKTVVLTNEELHQCNFHMHIPTNEDFSSLNLAAAVQVIAYELRVGALAIARGRRSRRRRMTL